MTVTLEKFLRLVPVREEPLSEDESWIPELRHLSATSIGMFRRCPEQFRQRYMLGRKERPGEGLVIGSFFHGALEHNYGQKIESHEDRPLKEIVEHLHDVVVPQTLADNGGVDEIKWDTDPQTAVMDAERVTTAYARRVMPRVLPVAVEEEFFIPFGAPVQLKGYVDVTAGMEVEMDTTTVLVPSHVVDTKTGKQGRTKLKPDWRLQATLYAIAKGLPVEYHTISRQKTPKIVTGLESPDLVVRVTPEQSENTLQVARRIATLIKHLYDTIGPDDTWPTLGAFPDWSMTTLPCDFCGYRKDCPAWIKEID